MTSRLNAECSMFTYNGTIYVYSILEQLMIYNINLKTAKPHTVYVKINHWVAKSLRFYSYARFVSLLQLCCICLNKLNWVSWIWYYLQVNAINLSSDAILLLLSREYTTNQMSRLACIYVRLYSKSVCRRRKKPCISIL